MKTQIEPPTAEQYITYAVDAIRTEQNALELLIEQLDERFVQACELVRNCKGRVVVTGMGKSGHIGRKIAATFASTGSPAFFMHPGEAGHGDLGMLVPGDVLLARWELAGRQALGIFSLKGGASVLPVDLPDGAYESLLDGRNIPVESGLVATDGQPIILITDKR